MAYGTETAKTSLDIHSGLIDVLFGIAELGRSPQELASLLHQLGRETDEQLWAAMSQMARLVGENRPGRPDMDMDGPQPHIHLRTSRPN